MPLLHSLIRIFLGSCALLGVTACTATTSGCIVVHHPERQLIVAEGCVMDGHNTHLTCKGTAEEIRARYAPIESEDEALSYALAATGYQAAYDLEKTFCNDVYLDYIAQVPQIEETHVERLENSYRIYLFTTDPIMGIMSVVVDVAPDGAITSRGVQQVAKPI